jgi:hypothetical protein
VASLFDDFHSPFFCTVIYVSGLWLSTCITHKNRESYLNKPLLGSEIQMSAL